MRLVLCGVLGLSFWACTGSGFAIGAAVASDNLLSADGDFIAISRNDGSLRLWRRAEPKNPLTLFEPLDAKRLKLSALSWRPVVAFSPDGSRVAAVRGDEAVAVWSTTGDMKSVWLRSKDVGENVAASLKFSPDGKLLVVTAYSKKGSGTDLLSVWSVPDGVLRTAMRFSYLYNFAEVAFSRDGKTLCMLLNDRELPLTGLLSWALDENSARFYALPVQSVAANGGGAQVNEPTIVGFNRWEYDPLQDLELPRPGDPPWIHRWPNPR